MKLTPIKRIIADGFLRYLPYLRELDPKKDDNSAKCDVERCKNPGKWWFKPDRRASKWDYFFSEGWYCSYHIWDAITTPGPEDKRYWKWQKKYIISIRGFIDEMQLTDWWIKHYGTSEESSSNQDPAEVVSGNTDNASDSVPSV